MNIEVRAVAKDTGISASKVRPLIDMVRPKYYAEVNGKVVGQLISIFRLP